MNTTCEIAPLDTYRSIEIANFWLKNPWLKKNPLLSMWLSGANRIAGSVRGHATAQAKRQVAATAKKASTETARLWTDALTGSRPAKKRKRRV